MSLRLTSVDDLPPHMRAQVEQQLRPPAPNPVRAAPPAATPAPVLVAMPTAQPKPRKYRNQPIVVNGQRFDSKLEGKRYLELLNLYALGMVRWFQLQPIFRLAPGIRYRADFQVVWTDGQVTVEDCKSKGTRTAVYKMKRKLLAEVWPQVDVWEIESVPAGMPAPRAGVGEP